MVVFFLSSSHVLGSTGITYHGRILRPNGEPVTSRNVQFRIQIRSPGSESCVLWEEMQTKDLSNSVGIFSITINDTSEESLVANTLPFSLERIFSNRETFTTLPSCSSGNVYNPNALDGRVLQVYFRESLSENWEQMPLAKINYVPMALNSVLVNGYGSSDFLKIDKSSTYTPLSSTQVNTLIEVLAGGANSPYIEKGQDFGGDLAGKKGAASTQVIGLQGRAVAPTAPASGQVLKFIGGVWAPASDDNTPAASDASYNAKGVLQVDSSLAVSGLEITNGVLSLPQLLTPGTLGGASSIPVISFDGKGRLISASAVPVNDLTKLSLTGGTMSGTLNMGLQDIVGAGSISAASLSVSGNATIAGSATAQSLSANVFSGRSLVLSDLSSKTATLRPPSSIADSYTLTLPASAPQNGYVLATDGAGNLSWIAPATGSVTSISSTNAYLSIGGAPATPTLTLNVGQDAQTVAAGNDSRIVNSVQQAAYSADVLGANTCAAGEVPYWSTDSDRWMCRLIGTVASSQNFTGSLAGDVSGSQGATLINRLQGTPLSLSSASAGQFLRFDGSQWSNSNIPLADIPPIDSAKITDGTLVNADLSPSAAIERTKIAAGSANHVVINDSSGRFSSEAQLSVGRGGTGVSSFAPNRVLASNSTGSAIQGFSCPMNQAITFDVSGNLQCGVVTGSGGFVNGGNTFGADASLGTNDNFGLSFRTNNVPRLSISPLGSVGLGTEAPVSRFHVVTETAPAESSGTKTFATFDHFMPGGQDIGPTTTIDLDFKFRDSNTTPGTDPVNPQARIRVLPGGDGQGYPNEASGQLLFLTATGDYANGTVSSNTLAERMRIDQYGNVGIGTSTPGHQLHLSSTTAGVYQAIERPQGTFGILQFATSGASRRFELGVDNSLETGGDAGSNFSIFRFDDSGAQRGPAFSITRASGDVTMVNNGGNVGIGTLTPNAKLDVSGQMRTKVAVSSNPAGNAIDFAEGNTQVVSFSSCSGNALVLNMFSLLEGGSYSVIVNAPANCQVSFVGTTAQRGGSGGTPVTNFYFPGGVTYPSTGVAMVYSFLRADNIVYGTQIIDLK